MPFTEPVKPNEPLEMVRRIARIAQMLLDMRSEYERRQRPDLLLQIQVRAKELYELSQTLDKPAEAPPEQPSS
ncbi:MAG: hypothetical protein WCS37_19305 [Chloroflexota bacterium]|nr:hypothetical protein [Chloroflexota bacterium]